MESPFKKQTAVFVFSPQKRQKWAHPYHTTVSGQTPWSFFLSVIFFISILCAKPDTRHRHTRMRVPSILKYTRNHTQRYKTDAQQNFKYSYIYIDKPCTNEYTLAPSHTHKHKVKSGNFTGLEATKHSKLVQITNKSRDAFRGWQRWGVRGRWSDRADYRTVWAAPLRLFNGSIVQLNQLWF